MSVKRKSKSGQKVNEYGLTDKQEMFCQYYVSLNNAKVSAIKAGYSENGATVAGSRLLADSKIQDRINTLRKEVVSELDMNAEQVVKWLYEIANPANEEPTGNRIKALELLGKYHAIFTDKKYVESNNTHNIHDYSNMSDEEVEKALQQFSALEEELNGIGDDGLN